MPLLSIAMALPELLVVLLGLVLSFAFRKRLGSRATLVLLGFVAMTVGELVALVSVVFSVNTPHIMHSLDLGYGQLGLIFTVLGAVRILFTLVGWALLLVALFRRNQDRPNPTGAATGPGAPFGQPVGQYPGGPMPGGPGSAPLPGQQHPWDQPAWGQPAPGQQPAGPPHGYPPGGGQPGGAPASGQPWPPGHQPPA